MLFKEAFTLTLTTGGPQIAAHAARSRWPVLLKMCDTAMGRPGWPANGNRYFQHAKSNASSDAPASKARNRPNHSGRSGPGKASRAGRDAIDNDILLFPPGQTKCFYAVDERLGLCYRPLLESLVPEYQNTKHLEARRESPLLAYFHSSQVRPRASQRHGHDRDKMVHSSEVI